MRGWETLIKRNLIELWCGEGQRLAAPGIRDIPTTTCNDHEGKHTIKLRKSSPFARKRSRVIKSLTMGSRAPSSARRGAIV